MGVCPAGPQCWGFAAKGANATYYDANCNPLYDLMTSACPGDPGIVTSGVTVSVGGSAGPAAQAGTTPAAGAVAVPFPPGPHYATVGGKHYVVVDANQGNSPEGWRVVVVVGLSNAYLDGTGMIRSGNGDGLGALLAGAPPAPEAAKKDDTTKKDDTKKADPGLDVSSLWNTYKLPIIVGVGGLALLGSGVLDGGGRSRRGRG